MAWRRRSATTPDPVEDHPVEDRADDGTDHGTARDGDDGASTLEPEVLDELAAAFGTDRAPRNTITIDGDDDLPDAVYLDEELARDDSSSGTVFIDDDGSSDAILPHDAAPPGIEPRLRQRRIGVNRAASRRRLGWLAVAAAVLVVVIGVLAVLGSSLFAVDRVAVTGNVYTDPDELAAVVADIEGTPVLLVDTDEAEAQLEDIPWVEDARVTASMPNRASIEIRERTPLVAMLGVDGLSRVLDEEGRVLDVIEGQPVALVWISGPGTLDLTPGEFAPIGYSAAASLVTKLTPTIRTRVESMLVTPDGSDLVMILSSPSGPIEVRFGSAIGDNAQIEKLVRLERQLDDLGDPADAPVQVIDVSTSEVTVR